MKEFKTMAYDNFKFIYSLHIKFVLNLIIYEPHTNVCRYDINGQSFI